MNGLNEPDTIEAQLRSKSTSKAKSSNNTAIWKTAALLSLIGVHSTAQSHEADWLRGSAAPPSKRTEHSALASHQAINRSFKNGAIGVDARIHMTITGQYSHAVSCQNVDDPVTP